MKVAIVTHQFSRNDGQGRVNYEIARHAARAGHAVCLIAAAVDSDLLAEPNVTWVPVSHGRLPTNLIRFQMLAFNSWRWLRKHAHEFDIVQVNGAVTWAPGHVNSVHYVHGGWFQSPYFSRSPGLRGLYETIFTRCNMVAERLSFRQARAIVAISGAVEHEVRRELGSSSTSGRLSHILNGVDASEFCPGPAQRRRFGLPEDKVIGLFAGDLLSERKNLETTLSAVAGAPGLHLAVAGTVGRSRFPELAQSLGIADRVHFLGLVRDMPALMRSVDMFVLPSRYEPWGMVIAEAMATGLSVVTSGATGASQLITPESGFVLDDPDEVHGLAAILRQLTSDEALRKRMGAAARSRVENMSWRAMAEQYLDLYHVIAGDERVRTVAGVA